MSKTQKKKIEDHIKKAEERLGSLPNPTTPTSAQPKMLASSYTSVLINPPAYTNPRAAAREGIKGRQFLIEGLKNSKFSHMDSVQLKTELKKILLDIGLTSGKSAQ